MKGHHILHTLICLAVAGGTTTNLQGASSEQDLLSPSVHSDDGSDPVPEQLNLAGPSTPNYSDYFLDKLVLRIEQMIGAALQTDKDAMAQFKINRLMFQNLSRALDGLDTRVQKLETILKALNMRVRDVETVVYARSMRLDMLEKKLVAHDLPPLDHHITPPSSPLSPTSGEGL